MASGNKKMSAARAAKNDEFYTQLPDIERELVHYRDHFRDKTVFLNCDDPTWSMFWVYFQQNFDHLGLRKLISTHFHSTEPTYMQTITRGEDLDEDGAHGAGDIVTTPLEGNGDFRSPECLALLEESDIVVTNPPFSLFREFMSLLIEKDKQFIVLGGVNAITYKEVWGHIQSGEIWLGATANSGEVWFGVPEDYVHSRNAREVSGGRQIGVGVRWFTNLEHNRHSRDTIPLFREYSPDEYPAYVNFDAIEVSKVADIPANYSGLMGVPITFLGKHNPSQFEIIGYSGQMARNMRDVDPGFAGVSTGAFYIASKDGSYRRLYDRIIIRRL